MKRILGRFAWAGRAASAVEAESVRNERRVTIVLTLYLLIFQ
jgi:hypothetical protein